MKALLKWPGGKTSELKVLEEFLRQPIRTYLEPFVGGGAVLFSLAGDCLPGRSVVADVNPDLVGLYQAVAGEDMDLFRALREFSEIWDQVLPDMVTSYLPALRDWFQRHGRQEGVNPPEKLMAPILAAFPISWARNSIQRSLLNKLQRSHKLEQKHETVFSPELIEDQLETGLRAGFYTYLRDILEPESPGVRGAVFFFLRQYCYGSMFRQNRQGRFNSPYGGKGYNKKRFAPRIEELIDPARVEFLSRVEVRQQDFREFFTAEAPGLGPEDLVFLDPPYDSAFQEYAGRAFGEGEQRDLAKIVAELPCRVLGIMQATPLIREIFLEAQETWRQRGRTLFLEEYEKTYAYNVRGRNNRDVHHLLIRG